MNFGFNSNIRLGTAVYHVQSEDRGAAHPFLDTVVYLAGRVIYKRSNSYEQFAGSMESQSLEKTLHERLTQQHRDVIAELEAGTLPILGKEIAAPAEDAPNTQDRLDLRLSNPESWFADGNVILKIELREGNSTQKIGDADIQAFLEHHRRRTPCADASTDSQGFATLKFAMPADAQVGSALVIRATDGTRYGELRFRLKSKAAEPHPAPGGR